MYEYVYREAAGVYWDNAKHGFKSASMKEWSCAQWYKQIVSIVCSGLGIRLLLADHVTWSNVSEKEKAEIQHHNAIRHFASANG